MNDLPKANVLCLIGTRPEAIKMFPVVLALQASGDFAPVVATTGQHKDLVDPILALADITPDVDLEVGRPGLTLNDLVATVIQRLDAFCRDRYAATGAAIATRDEILHDGFPVATLVHGDTSSAAAAAIASFNLRIPVVHVEAGLRTRTTLSPFPEELNRQLISRMASFHLAPTSINEENLVRERIPYEQVFVTGNTGIDALRYAANLDVVFDDPAVAEAVASGDPLVTVTAHRRENWAGGIARIAEGIGRLAADHPSTWFVLPQHPNPLVREELAGLRGQANVVLTEPLSYAPFARLMARSTVIVTDSGGIQEEAPALGVPVLVTRDSTERSEGLAAGTLRLVGTNPDRIVAAGDELLTDPAAHEAMASAVNPYGDGHASARIVSALEYLAGLGSAPERFGPGFSRRAVLAAAGYPRGLATGPDVQRGEAPDRSEEHDRWVGR